MTTVTTRASRDGRNSHKRIEQAKASVEAARRRVEAKASSNAWRVFRSIEAAHRINGGKEFCQLLPGYNGLRGFNLIDLACDITNLSVSDLKNDSIIDSRLEILWERAKYHCHDKCKSYFMSWGSLPYTNLYNPSDPIKCLACASGLGCEHSFKELTAAEANKLGVKHYGMCWHVIECQHCGEIQSYDSSD